MKLNFFIYTLFWKECSVIRTHDIQISKIFHTNLYNLSYRRTMFIEITTINMWFLVIQKKNHFREKTKTLKTMKLKGISSWSVLTKTLLRYFDPITNLKYSEIYRFSRVITTTNGQTENDFGELFRLWRS